jgi:hypothetical protein
MTPSNEAFYTMTPEKQMQFHKLKQNLCNPFSTTPGHEVLMFMTAFDQIPVEHPTKMRAEDWALGEKLIVEECEKEMLPALKKLIENYSMENLAEFVDGAMDTIYVLCWFLLKMGVNVDECFDEVQRSNMAKLLPDGSYLKNPQTGKVMKPPHWTPPDLLSVLVAQLDPTDWKHGVAQHAAPGRDRSE